MKNNKVLKLAGNILLVLVFVGIILYVIRNSLHEIFEGLKTTSFAVLLMVILLGVVYQLVEGVNIARLVNHFQTKFNWLDGFWCSCSVAFYRVISFGSATAVSEVLFYRKKDVETSEAIGVAAIHMILYKSALIIFSIAGLLVNLRSIWSKSRLLIVFVLIGVIMSFLIIVAILVISGNQKLHHWLLEKLLKIVKKDKWRKSIYEASNQLVYLRSTILTVVKDKGIFISLIGLNLLKLMFWLCIPYVVLAPHHQISFVFTFSMTAFAVILSGVIPAPAGIGSFEFVYLMLFRPFVGVADAASSMLIYRFASYVLPFLIGLVYVAKNKRIEIHEEFQEIKEEHDHNQ